MLWNYPLSEGAFIIATPENVIGIIEVKTRIEPAKICEIIETANKNAEVISGNMDISIFNGIFSYNSIDNSDNYINRLEDYNFSQVLQRRHFNQIAPPALFTCVNHIALGNRYFIKLWPVGQNDNSIDSPHYSVYDMQDGLAFSYFLSNLQEYLIRNATGYIEGGLPEEMNSFFYPIPEGKEAHLIKRILLRQQTG